MTRPSDPLRPARGIMLGLALSPLLWSAIVGAVMLGGFKIGLDQSAASARVNQERDAPRLIRSASSVQSGAGQ